MCFCVRACVHVEPREWHCFSHSLCLGFGDKVYLLKLELADLAPGTLLSLPPRCWDCKHVLPCLTFPCCWDLDPGPSAYPAGTLPICPWSKHCLIQDILEMQMRRCWIFMFYVLMSALSYVPFLRMCDVCFSVSLLFVLCHWRCYSWGCGSPGFSDPGGALHELQDRNVALPMEDEI